MNDHPTTPRGLTLAAAILAAAILVAAVLVAACSALQYHPGDSFAETQQFAIAKVPEAELDLARMYADPAAYPASRGRAPDRLQAAKWCYILANGPPPRASGPDPSCSDILAATSPQDRDTATEMARAWLEGSQGDEQR